MNQIEIRSKDNPQFRKLKTLLTSKGIREEKLFFVMGEKLVHELLAEKNSIYKIQYAVGSIDQSLALNQKSIRLSNELFSELDVLNTDYPMFVCSYNEFPEINWQIKPDGLQIVSPIGDPKNFGSLCRSAVGFGAKSIVTLKESCHPFLPHSIRSSAGAVLKIEILSSKLSIQEIPITHSNFALDMTGDPLENCQIDPHSRLILGEEGLGLPIHLKENKKVQKIKINTEKIDSLNVTVSASIALWYLGLKKF